MSETHSFVEVVQRLDAGDEQAAREVFYRYSQRLTGLARNRLGRGLRPKLDPEDIVQSVFRSFFTRQAKGQFEFTGWEDLWTVLAVITLRKCGRQAETFHAACRDIRREWPAAPDSSASPDAYAAVTREPTPDEVAICAETLERLATAMNATECEIFALRLQGYTPLEISGQVAGVSERKVYRVLAQIRKQLERMQDEA